MSVTKINSFMTKKLQKLKIAINNPKIIKKKNVKISFYDVFVLIYIVNENVKSIKSFFLRYSTHFCSDCQEKDKLENI